MPHAAVLTTAYRGAGDGALESVRASLPQVRAHLDADVVVIVSPHARRSGTYAVVGGDLADFGLGDRPALLPTDEDASTELSDRWRPAQADPSDHGVVVPLLLEALPPGPAVAAGIAEVTGPDAPAGHGSAVEDAHALANAIRHLARRRDVAVVASAHLGAALDAGAPLWPTQEAAVLEERVLAALQDDVGGVADMASDLARTGSCGGAPLAVLASLFAGAPLRLLCYERPFGVGYVVGTVR